MNVADSSLLDIARAAILAPSADNTPIFDLELDDQSIRLIARSDFRGQPFHRRILALIALGAAVENMRLAAGSRGCSLEAAWFPDGPAGETLVTAYLHKDDADPSHRELAAAIEARHTNRRVVFRGPRLSQQECHEIERAVRSNEHVDLLWADHSPLRNRLLNLLWVAESTRFRCEPLHAELFASIRFDVGWHQGVTEGLSPGSLCIEPGARRLFYGLRRWSTMSVLRHFGVDRLLGFRAAWLPCRMAPHLGVLSTDLDVESGALAVGRALQAIWLIATAKGLAFQPLAGPTLLALEKYSEVPASVRIRLRNGWDRVTPGRLPLMTFRLGRARAPEIVNGRRALEDSLRVDLPDLAIPQKKNP